MTVHRRRMLSLAGAGVLSACATARGAAPAPRPRIAPLQLSPHRLMKITVCTRPFRAAGPRIEVEPLGDKRVVHNYGHGGSGWSLAWGSADLAARLALETGPKAVAVVGAGALGLTAASRLREAGVAVTIYGKEFPAESRSARATGTWSPDSRIALAADAPAGFAERWETMARASFAAHQAYVGLDNDPVEWTERYLLDDATPSAKYEVHGFAYLNARLRDLTPRFEPLAFGAHPFPTAKARRGVVMTFNVAEYAHRILTDFLTMGGAIRRATFAAPSDMAALAEPVIVNCTGYGARSLWRDESLIPVRGQIGWLAPQAEARYGLHYRHISLLARRDGIVVQHGGETDASGYGVADETPNRAEFDDALARVAPLFANWPA